MSRRESCVWHPMPEEVRRSSVQSRRASLAAGRRKSMNTNEPDWEVEAPATPTRQDYTPRDEVAVAAAPVAVAAAAPVEEHSPVENDVAAQAAAEEVAEREAVASVKSAEPTEVSEEEGALQATAQADAEAAGKGRTRHLVRFHGDKWAKVLQKKRTEIEAAFLEDIKECAGVEAEEAKRLKIKMRETMEVSFVVHSESRARQKKIHAALLQYKFPNVRQVALSFEA